MSELIKMEGNIRAHKKEGNDRAHKNREQC